MDPAQVEESLSQPTENKKRKTSKDSPFTVNSELVNVKRQTFSLKMVKPDVRSKVDVGVVTYPTVCLKQEIAGNEHAFRIMHDLRHKNILSMKVLCKNKVQCNDSSSPGAFVEPYEGLLWSKCDPPLCADKIKHIPSPIFQSYVRQIIIGLDFLRKNGLYHGNLSWDSTLYHGDTIKLAGFISKEPMTIEEAQWFDWLCFVTMLQVISDRAAQCNQSLSEEERYFCSHLDSLITMLKTLDRTSLPTIKDSVLEQTFFWDLTRRIKFFANSVSLKLDDQMFLERVNNSCICKKHWDKNCTDGFKQLVKIMNDYRRSQRRKGYKDQYLNPYDGESLEDYVKCICGAYTHWRQIKLDVDRLIRENHPMVCSDVKIILEASNNDITRSRGVDGGTRRSGAGRGSCHGAAAPGRGAHARSSSTGRRSGR